MSSLLVPVDVICIMLYHCVSTTIPKWRLVVENHLRQNTTLTLVNLQEELGFSPLSQQERKMLKEWALAVNSPYSDMIVRLLDENEYHSQRFIAYQIIEQDVLDMIVRHKIEEKGWSWA